MLFHIHSSISLHNFVRCLIRQIIPFPTVMIAFKMQVFSMFFTEWHKILVFPIALRSLHNIFCLWHSNTAHSQQKYMYFLLFLSFYEFSSNLKIGFYIRRQFLIHHFISSLYFLDCIFLRFLFLTRINHFVPINWFAEIIPCL